MTFQELVNLSLIGTSRGGGMPGMPPDGPLGDAVRASIATSPEEQLLSAAAGVVAWRRVGTLGHQLRMPHTMWLASLLALMLPAHLVTFAPITGSWNDPAWPILPAGAMILVMLLWMLGGIGAGRAQPVLIAYLLLGMLFSGQLSSHCVLQRDRLVTGDVRNCAPSPAAAVSTEPWVRRVAVPR